MKEVYLSLSDLLDIVDKHFNNEVEKYLLAAGADPENLDAEVGIRDNMSGCKIDYTVRAPNVLFHRYLTLSELKKIIHRHYKHQGKYFSPNAKMEIKTMVRRRSLKNYLPHNYYRISIDGLKFSW